MVGGHPKWVAPSASIWKHRAQHATNRRHLGAPGVAMGGVPKKWRKNS